MAQKAMTTSHMTDKQIERAVEIFRAQLRTNAKELPSEAVQKAFGKAELAQEWFEVLRRHAEATMFLAPRGCVTIALATEHNPDVFYRTRERLYVWDDFRERIVAKAQPSRAGTTMHVDIAELMKDLTDEEIESALPKSHLFDETKVCAIIDGLIGQQPNGEEGKLLNNGYANLFYTASCVVFVLWDSDDRGWYVSTYDRGGDGWSAGFLVFSPATET